MKHDDNDESRQVIPDTIILSKVDGVPTSSKSGTEIFRNKVSVTTRDPEVILIRFAFGVNTTSETVTFFKTIDPDNSASP